MTQRYVKKNLPKMYRKLCRSLLRYQRNIYPETLSPITYIIIFTTQAIPSVGPLNVRGTVPRPEERLSPHPWPAPSSSGEGSGRVVPCSTVLRSSRSAPGPVRDASSPSGRRALHSQDRRTVRGLTSYLLSCRVGLCRARPPRTRPSKAGPEGTSPMHSGDRHLRSGPIPRRASAHLEHPASGDRPEVRDLSPSKDARARAHPGRKKRAPANGPPSTTPACSPLIESAYEALRGIVIDGGSPGASPLGLGVFVLRGWVGWAEALPTLLPPGPPSPTERAVPLSAPLTPDRELVHALAGLVLSYLEGGP